MLDLQTFFDQVAQYQDSGVSQDDAKRAAAEAALDLVESGMTLGLGTGSTVEFFLQGLAEKIRQGLQVRGVPTSQTTRRRATELGIPLYGDPHYPDLRSQLCVDGADRVDTKGCLIKGGGGALFREKLVACHSERVCILVDPSKLRDVLDDSFAVPVECLNFGIDNTVAALAALGCTPRLRGNPESPYLTDNGHVIVDCEFSRIPDPVATALRVSALAGVVEVGLFCDLLDHLIVGYKDGTAASWSRTGPG